VCVSSLSSRLYSTPPVVQTVEVLVYMCVAQRACVYVSSRGPYITTILPTLLRTTPAILIFQCPYFIYRGSFFKAQLKQHSLL
jgi:hypothetical protein